jgi:predicted Rossmann fold nucleotide-binding protein DprA/Smf involved in DNA uptake
MTAPNMHVDDIIEKTGMAPAKVLAELTMLQLRGYVTQESGKRFTLNIRTK